jgi:ubiquinone/menaquinone biosynthesis C-methylase UbiE
LSIFAYLAPLAKMASLRWSSDDFRIIAERLKPYVPPGGVFADLGGGTGDLGAGVAPLLDARVIIVDPTPQMLLRVDPHPWVSTRLASAERLPFPPGYLDAVLCSDSFHHFRDQETAIKEIHRVVRPGGGVLMLEPEARPGVSRLVLSLERLLGEPGAWLTAAGLEAMLATHGIVGISRRQTKTSYLFVGTVRP